MTTFKQEQQGGAQGGRYRIAIDIGGTFVDAVAFDEQTGQVQLAKAPTTPASPEEGVMEAVRRLGIPLGETRVFVHGTTLGLNAVLERRGARTGLITNEGMRDVLEIRRADVPPERMYDLHHVQPAPLVRRRHRIGVPCRLDAQGDSLTPLDEQAVVAAADTLVAEGVQAIAVSFLHAWRNPAQEQRAAALIRARHPGVPVSVGSEVAREIREYERTSTAVLDAYIRPIFETYIGRLERALAEAGFVGRFLVMRSSGGAMTASVASRAPLATVLSGPAGGIVGACRVARVSERPRMLTLDYGGTSLDASVIEDGQPAVMYEAQLEQFPVLMPVFDIRCIGTGGGSIASVQEGLLQVGPRSAGAVPGPMAYGRGGTEPTTTDAALVLGYIDAAGFLGGKLPLDAERAHQGVVQKLAEPLGADAWTVAAGVFDVLIAKTVGAIREITVERGKDPAEFSLLAFGGAGPMIAPMIARELGARELIVPRVPAVFSAWGMLFSDLQAEFAQTEIVPLDDAHWAQVQEGLEALQESADAALATQQVPASDRRFERSLECRYAGQEHSLEVACLPESTPQALAEAFHALHLSRYGHRLQEPVQVVTLRVRAAGELRKPPAAPLPPATADVESARRGTREAYCFARRAPVPFAVYDRALLAPGHVIQGPAIVDEGTSTTVLHGDQTLSVDAQGQLIIRTLES
jgi:N-methylhydantoinase A